jgi:hypothetical protein
MQPFYLPEGVTVDAIGVSGKKGSGKTTLTRLALIKQGYIPIPLARHFKVDMVAKDGAPAAEVFGAAETKSATTRDALQKRGTELGRNVYGEDVWLRHLEAHILDFVAHGITRFVIPDVRFPNEVEYVQQALGGKVYRIIGRGVQSGDAHPSETALDGYDGFDAVIDNRPENAERAPRLLAALAAADFGPVVYR